MLNIPVCGYSYEVVTTELPEHINGLCDPNKRLISLSSEMTGGLIDEVLLHEVVHAVFFETGISELLKSRVEEAICVALSKHLMQAGYRRSC